MPFSVTVKSYGPHRCGWCNCYLGRLGALLQRLGLNHRQCRAHLRKLERG